MCDYTSINLATSAIFSSYRNKQFHNDHDSLRTSDVHHITAYILTVVGFTTRGACRRNVPVSAEERMSLNILHLYQSNFQILAEPIHPENLHVKHGTVVKLLPSLITLLLSICALKRANDTLTDLVFAKRAQGVDLQPFIYTFLVEKVRTWQLSQFIIVSILRQADATDLRIIFKTISISLIFIFNECIRTRLSSKHSRETS